jgi:hypothetical protein
MTRRNGNEIPPHFLPLEDPVWVGADGASYLVDDDAILGFEVDGQARAVPWDVMAAHHVANLELNGRPYVLTLCDACVGGGLFDASIDGTRFFFRIDGTYEGTPYALDEQTGSVWTMVTMRPLLGAALELGPLPRHPMVHATWAEWRTLHPDTLVVHEPGEPEDGHGGSHRWPGHTYVPTFAERRSAPKDDRLDPLDLVLGINLDGTARAYPLDRLHEVGGILNDELAGRPIVAVSIPGTYLAIGFHREVDGKVLELSWDGGPEAAAAAVHGGGSAHLIDAATGTRWDLFGTAVDGPLAGSQLAYAWGGLQKWFNWSNLNVGADLWQPAVTPSSPA